MTRFKRWLIKGIIREEVIQGYHHADNITGLYLLIRQACEEEFTEDNAPTMDAFLKERFDLTQYNKGKE